MIPIRDVIPARTAPVMTIAIIVVNTLAFLFQVSLPRRELQAFVREWGLVPAAFGWTTVVSSMFLHGGWLHYLGNMWYLWIFGDNVEDRMGHLRFVAFYLLCGVAASLGHVAVSPSSTVPTIGASGAIAGVMGAYFVLFPRSRILTLVPIVFVIQLLEVPAIFFLGFWFVLQLFSGVGSIAASSASAGGVAFWAHVAGFVAGAVLVFGFRRPERIRVEWWHRA
jgi:membrane associated rhomboid family serine protease